ncbi:MAG: hypothetical protein CMM93_03590 [Rickettsiales bacterium]|nr:hypothetical protein [Rickettsiales bacterium]|tara:strand:+ start:439 stop:1344 length:906 start_codon:yes stop_codon:yes gene_type:complete
MTKPTLLPAGFYDLPPEMAQAEAMCTHTLLDVFEQAGFQLVQPPLLEYTDTQGHLDDSSFKVMDPMTQRMMTLRSDMTPQVARMAASMGEKSLLCYSGQVIRTLPHPMHQTRQLRQIGVECCGEIDDLRVLRVVRDALNAYGITQLSIDLASPALWKALDISQSEELTHAVTRKDSAALTALDQPLLAKLCRINGAWEEQRDALQALNLPDAAAEAMQALLNQAEAIAAELPETPITLDPLDQAQRRYYTGISYHIYDRTSGRLIGRGGHYRNPFDNKPGCGITLYSEDLLAARDLCSMSS